MRHLLFSHSSIGLEHLRCTKGIRIYSMMPSSEEQLVEPINLMGSGVSYKTHLWVDREYFLERISHVKRSEQHVQDAVLI